MHDTVQENLNYNLDGSHSKSSMAVKSSYLFFIGLGRSKSSLRRLLIRAEM